MTAVDRPDVNHGRALAAPYRFTTPSIRSENLFRILRQLVFVILLTRSSCDPLFQLSSTDFGGSTMGLGAVMNALVIALAVVCVVVRPSAVPLAPFAMWGPYLLVVFGATLYAPQFTTAARVFMVNVSYGAMFALPFLVFRAPDDLPRFVTLLLASSIVPSLHALWEMPLAFADPTEFRLQGTFGHPNIFAFYLVLMLGLALYVLATPSCRWPSGLRRIVTWYIPFLLLLLVLTKTRSAWAACAVMFLAYAIWVDRRLLISLLLVPLLLATNTILSERLSDLSGGEEIESLSQLSDSVRLNSLAWREALWTSALPSVGERLAFGHGLESFRPSTPEFFPLVGPEGMDAHNLYLQILFEAGVVGLAAFFWLVGSLVRALARGFRYQPKGTVVVFAILVSYLLESYSDNMIYYLVFNWYFMFTMGMICAWLACERNRQGNVCRRAPPHTSAVSTRSRSELPYAA